jgi:hypothetical protein
MANSWLDNLLMGGILYEKTGTGAKVDLIPGLRMSSGGLEGEGVPSFQVAVDVLNGKDPIHKINPLEKTNVIKCAQTDAICSYLNNSLIPVLAPEFHKPL